MTEQEFLGEAGVPPKYQKARLKDHPEKLNLDGSYYFFSPNPGTGKTHLAWAFMNEKLLQQGTFIPAYKFTTFGKLQLRLRSAIKTEIETEEEILRELSNARLLILDDVGGMRPNESSDYSLSILFEILNARYSWERQTIITSNQSIGDLSKTFDERIASRIVGMAQIIKLDGTDRRVDGI